MENQPIIAFIQKIAEDLTGRVSYQGRSHSFRCLKIGDEVHFRFLGRGKRKYNKIESIVLHADHSSVKCSYFGICGGCSGQHIPYEEQFYIKTEQLAQNYRETWEVEPILIPAKSPYRYRNRMDFAIFPEKSGLRESGNFRKLVDIDTCLIQSEWAEKEWKIIREYIKSHSGIELNRKSESGSLKYVTLRYSFSTQDSMSIFTWDQSKRENPEELEFEKWIIEHSTAKNILFCYNPRPSEVSAVGEYRIIKGQSYYQEKILNKFIQVPFDSFFQPNPVQFEHILHRLEGWIQKYQPTNLIDLFCGGGFFSIVFGSYFQKIAGWEVNKTSVITAQKTLSSMYPNVESSFESIDLFQKKFIPKFLESYQAKNFDPKETLLIIDPPRNGAGSFILEWIRDSEIQYIAYVSCNPKGQWNEILNFLGKDFTPIEVMITDPYPQTPHLESLVVLERKNKIVDFKS
jgi:tRNA (uracil-5-)-methyltransferase